MSQNFLGPWPQQEFNALQASSSAQQDGLAIVSNGNTHAAIASGQFVYVKNHSSLAEGLYKATAAIATNGTLSTSNLTADASGGLNALKADVDTLNSNINILNNDKLSFIYLGAISSNSSKTLTTENGGRYILWILGTNKDRSGLYYIYVRATGDVTPIELIQGQSIHVSSDDTLNQVIVTSDSSTNSTIYAFCLVHTITSQ